MTALGIEIRLTLDKFEMHAATMRNQLKDPIVQDLVKRAIRVEAAAKENATRRPGPMVITGRLRASIGYRIGSDSYGPYVDIGSGVDYAPFVEFGHRNTAHAYPKRDGTVGFVSNRPTKPYPFLVPALEAARTT
jgi:Bacteriophage HK97-gp10, putative tail-component